MIFIFKVRYQLLSASVFKLLMNYPLTAAPRSAHPQVIANTYTNKSSTGSLSTVAVQLSVLTIIPFNQASIQDIEALTESQIISMPTPAWIWTTSYLSLVFPKTVDK